jgi:hypothetical protein
MIVLLVFLCFEQIQHLYNGGFNRGLTALQTRIQKRESAQTVSVEIENILKE